MQSQRVAQGAGEVDRVGRSVQDALNRLIMVASSADGMDGAAVLEVEHGDDLEGHFRHGASQPR